MTEYAPQGFGTVLSDMCHPTIGTKSADAARSLDLGEAAAALSLGTGFAEGASLLLAVGGSYPSRDVCPSTVFKAFCFAEIEMNKPHHNGILVPGGNFVVKLLEGAGEQSAPNSPFCKQQALHVSAILTAFLLRIGC